MDGHGQIDGSKSIDVFEIAETYRQAGNQKGRQPLVIVSVAPSCVSTTQHVDCDLCD